MKAGLTKRQKEVLGFISAYIVENGVAPTLAEIGVAVGLRSKSSVHRIVVGLVERGAVTYMPNRARSIALLEPGTLPPMWLVSLQALDAYVIGSKLTHAAVIHAALTEYFAAHPVPGETL